MWRASSSPVSSKKITKGELLGYLGSTGNAAMPHLHIEIKYKGSCVTNAYNDYFGMNYSSSSFGNLGKCDVVDIYIINNIIIVLVLLK